MFVANTKTLSTKQIEKIKSILINLKPLDNKADKKITKNWNKRIKFGAIEVKDGDYKLIEKALKENSSFLQEAGLQ